MKMHPMTMVTIVTEAFALEPLKQLLREVGAQGWTHFRVEGEGAGGERTGEMPELSNVQVEVILTPEKSATLLTRLETDYFPRYAMVAMESDVRVIRSGKF